MTDKEFEKAMDIIAAAISDAGYNVREQLTGFLLTGDPTYITSHNNARVMIMKVERDELIEEALHYYINNKLK